MGRSRLHEDDRARWRAYYERKTKAKKPYYAKRATIRTQLEDMTIQTLKAAQGVYDVP